MVNGSIPWMRAQGVLIRRQGKRLVGPVGFDLSSSGIVILMGPNGAGKTTLLRAMHGVERINQGRVLWTDPTDAEPHNQAFVFQTPILMRRSVQDNIAYPLRLDGVPMSEARARARDAAKSVGLNVDPDTPAYTCSGGEKQKLALARALIRDPRILFLDEPCANLDGRATKEIEETLLRINRSGTRLIMSTHDIGQARRLAETVLFLHDGHLVEQSEGAAFFDGPRTSEAQAYLKGDILL